MSKENVEVVRRLFDLLEGGGLAEMEALVAEDFEFDRSASRSPDRAVHRGPEALRRLWEGALEAWSEYVFYEIEMIDAGDTVIRVGGLRARGRESDVAVEAYGATVWRFRDGTAISVSLHQNKDEALEAAGLSEYPEK